MNDTIPSGPSGQSGARHEAEYGFDTDTAVRLFVELGAGSLLITATEAAPLASTVHIVGKRAGEVAVEQTEAGISIIAPKQRTGFLSGDQKFDVVVKIPSGSSAVVRTGSADVNADGVLDAVQVKSGSGDVRLDQVAGALVVDTGSGSVRVPEAAAPVRIRSGSGDISVGSAADSLSVSTGSGDVRIVHSLGAVAVKTGSGDLEIREADTDVSMKTGSGDVVIGTAHRGKITSKAASGDVRIGIPDGTPVWTDLSTVSGRVRSALRSVGAPEAGADHVELRATTVSGDIDLLPA